MGSDHWLAITSTVLACEDTNIYVPKGMDAMARGMDLGVSKVSIRGCEHQCVERHLWERCCTVWEHAA